MGRFMPFSWLADAEDDAYATQQEMVSLTPLGSTPGTAPRSNQPKVCFIISFQSQMLCSLDWRSDRQAFNCPRHADSEPVQTKPGNLIQH